MINEVRYLGDGVYVKSDGYGFALMANHHENPTDRVYLEPEVFDALNAFAQDIKNFCLKNFNEHGEPHE